MGGGGSPLGSVLAPRVLAQIDFYSTPLVKVLEHFISYNESKADPNGRRFCLFGSARRTQTFGAVFGSARAPNADPTHFVDAPKKYCKHFENKYMHLIKHIKASHEGRRKSTLH